MQSLGSSDTESPNYIIFFMQRVFYPGQQEFAITNISHVVPKQQLHDPKLGAQCMHAAHMKQFHEGVASNDPLQGLKFARAGGWNVLINTLCDWDFGCDEHKLPIQLSRTHARKTKQQFFFFYHYIVCMHRRLDCL